MVVAKFLFLRSNKLKRMFAPELMTIATAMMKSPTVKLIDDLTQILRFDQRKASAVLRALCLVLPHSSELNLFIPLFLEMIIDAWFVDMKCCNTVNHREFLLKEAVKELKSIYGNLSFTEKNQHTSEIHLPSEQQSNANTQQIQNIISLDEGNSGNNSSRKNEEFSDSTLIHSSGDSRSASQQPQDNLSSFVECEELKSLCGKLDNTDDLQRLKEAYRLNVSQKQQKCISKFSYDEAWELELKNITYSYIDKMSKQKENAYKRSELNDEIDVFSNLTLSSESLQSIEETTKPAINLNDDHRNPSIGSENYQTLDFHIGKRKYGYIKEFDTDHKEKLESLKNAHRTYQINKKQYGENTCDSNTESQYKVNSHGELETGFRMENIIPHLPCCIYGTILPILEVESFRSTFYSKLLESPAYKARRALVMFILIRGQSEKIVENLLDDEISTVVMEAIDCCKFYKTDYFKYFEKYIRDNSGSFTHRCGVKIFPYLSKVQKNNNLIRLTKCESWHIRCSAVSVIKECLKDLDSHAIDEAAITLLTDDSAFVRREASNLIEFVSNQCLVDSMKIILKDDCSIVRSNGLEALYNVVKKEYERMSSEDFETISESFNSHASLSESFARSDSLNSESYEFLSFGPQIGKIRDSTTSDSASKKFSSKIIEYETNSTPNKDIAIEIHNSISSDNNMSCEKRSGIVDFNSHVETELDDCNLSSITDTDQAKDNSHNIFIDESKRLYLSSEPGVEANKTDLSVSNVHYQGDNAIEAPDVENTPKTTEKGRDVTKNHPIEENIHSKINICTSNEHSQPKLATSQESVILGDGWDDLSIHEHNQMIDKQHISCDITTFPNLDTFSAVNLDYQNEIHSNDAIEDLHMNLTNTYGNNLKLDTQGKYSDLFEFKTHPVHSNDEPFFVSVNVESDTTNPNEKNNDVEIHIERVDDFYTGDFAHLNSRQENIEPMNDLKLDTDTKASDHGLDIDSDSKDSNEINLFDISSSDISTHHRPKRASIDRSISLSENSSFFTHSLFVPDTFFYRVNEFLTTAFLDISDSVRLNCLKTFIILRSCFFQTQKDKGGDGIVLNYVSNSSTPINNQNKGIETQKSIQNNESPVLDFYHLTLPTQTKTDDEHMSYKGECYDGLCGADSRINNSDIKNSTKAIGGDTDSQSQISNPQIDIDSSTNIVAYKNTDDHCKDNGLKKHGCAFNNEKTTVIPLQNARSHQPHVDFENEKNRAALSSGNDKNPSSHFSQTFLDFFWPDVVSQTVNILRKSPSWRIRQSIVELFTSPFLLNHPQLLDLSAFLDDPVFVVRKSAVFSLRFLLKTKPYVFFNMYFQKIVEICNSGSYSHRVTLLYFLDSFGSLPDSLFFSPGLHILNLLAKDHAFNMRFCLYCKLTELSFPHKYEMAIREIIQCLEKDIQSGSQDSVELTSSDL